MIRIFSRPIRLVAEKKKTSQTKSFFAAWLTNDLLVVVVPCATQFQLSCEKFRTLIIRCGRIRANANFRQRCNYYNATMIIWRGLFSCKLDAINSLVKDDVSRQEMSTLRVFVPGFLPLFGDEFFKQNCVRQSVFGTDTGRRWVFFWFLCKKKNVFGIGDWWFVVLPNAWSLEKNKMVKSSPGSGQCFQFFLNVVVTVIPNEKN